ncbi:hypothetical protein DFH09DRAFT_1377577 [Mycena vulgaris]|nr:hypothetical protein DFH09DRAFT_1377577 [Mycena vulgaris]
MRAFKTLGDPIHINIILPVESLDPRRGPSLAPSGPGVPPRSCTPSLRSSKDTAERAQAVPHTHGAIFSAAASLAPRPVLSEEDDSGAPSLAPGPIDERRKSAEAVTSSTLRERRLGSHARAAPDVPFYTSRARESKIPRVMSTGKKSWATIFGADKSAAPPYSLGRGLVQHGRPQGELEHAASADSSRARLADVNEDGMRAVEHSWELSARSLGRAEHPPHRTCTCGEETGLDNGEGPRSSPLPIHQHDKPATFARTGTTRSPAALVVDYGCGSPPPGHRRAASIIHIRTRAPPTQHPNAARFESTACAFVTAV